MLFCFVFDLFCSALFCFSFVCLFDFVSSFTAKHYRNSHNTYFTVLQSIGTSADIEFDLCDAEDRCQFAGTFAILGGPLEMPWRFDRLFKYDVTSVFRQMRLRPDSVYHFQVRLTAVNGTELDAGLLEAPLSVLCQADVSVETGGASFSCVCVCV